MPDSGQTSPNLRGEAGLGTSMKRRVNSLAPGILSDTQCNGAALFAWVLVGQGREPHALRSESEVLQP